MADNVSQRNGSTWLLIEKTHKHLRPCTYEKKNDISVARPQGDRSLDQDDYMSRRIQSEQLCFMSSTSNITFRDQRSEDVAVLTAY